MTHLTPRTIVYTDDRGTTYTETVITASIEIIRAEELERDGYTIVR